FTKWLYKSWIFRRPTGALVISKEIEDRVRQRSADVNPDLLIHRVPAVVDTRLFSNVSPKINGADPSVPTFIYCGVWPSDARFVISAFALVKRKGYRCKLMI